MSDRTPQEYHLDPSVPEELAAELRRLHAAPPVPPRVDAAVLARARARLAEVDAPVSDSPAAPPHGHAPRRRPWSKRRWMPAAAVAAVVLLAILPLWRGSAVRDISATPGDVDASGTVDVVDAYLLARALRGSSPLPAGADIDGDGAVTAKDVDAIAREAVRLSLAPGRGRAAVMMGARRARAILASALVAFALAAVDAWRPGPAPATSPRSGAADARETDGRAADRADDRTGDRTGTRFESVDIYVDSGGIPLAAYQLELVDARGQSRIVGIEGGGHPAFAEPPYYDPVALQGERIRLAAFSTDDTLPRGRVRVATLHMEMPTRYEPELELEMIVAAGPDATRIEVVSDVRGGHGGSRSRDDR